MTIGIIDYGCGNLFSLESSFAHIGAKTKIVSDLKTPAFDKLVLPGVGAFGDAAERLHSSALAQDIKTLCRNGMPLLGICLGMQLLFEESSEYGVHRGLALMSGRVAPLEGHIARGFKIPHMGWNALEITNGCPLFYGISSGEYAYFVHSYFALSSERDTVAIADYGGAVTAAVCSGNIFGTQFHPEKSGEVGLKILKNFAEL